MRVLFASLFSFIVPSPHQPFFLTILIFFSSSICLHFHILNFKCTNIDSPLNNEHWLCFEWPIDDCGNAADASFAIYLFCFSPVSVRHYIESTDDDDDALNNFNVLLFAARCSLFFFSATSFVLVYGWNGIKVFIVFGFSCRAHTQSPFDEYQILASTFKVRRKWSTSSQSLPSICHAPLSRKTNIIIGYSAPILTWTLSRPLLCSQLIWKSLWKHLSLTIWNIRCANSKLQREMGCQFVDLIHFHTFDIWTWLGACLRSFHGRSRENTNIQCFEFISHSPKIHAKRGSVAVVHS